MTRRTGPFVASAVRTPIFCTVDGSTVIALVSSSPSYTGTMSMPMVSFRGAWLISPNIMVDLEYLTFRLLSDGVVAAGDDGCFRTGTSFIPQIGQSPGWSCTTCACMLHV